MATKGLVAGTAISLVGLALTPVVLPILGFGSAGVVASSWAAGVMGPAVVSGGLFATAQSIAVTGFTAWGYFTTVAASAGVGAAVGATLRGA